MRFLNETGFAHFTTWVKNRLSGKQDVLTPDTSIKLQDGNIGVALPIKFVTKAEYNALSEEEKQAEAVYIVNEPLQMPEPSVESYDTDDGWHVRK